MRWFLLTFFCGVVSCASVTAETVIDFEELDGYDVTVPMGKGQYFNGYGEGASAGEFVSNGASFQTNEFGPGFSYSNVNDPTSPGFGNQFAAFPGGGSDGSSGVAAGTNYALVSTGSSVLADGTPTNGATMNFADLVQLLSMDIANATYAALYMRDGTYTNFGGDVVFDPTAQFGDGDFLRLSITGFDGSDGTGKVTGQLDYDLANYGGAGSADDFLLSNWETLDLSDFGEVRSLRFSTTSSQISDFGEFGIFHDVPSYAAIDNIRLVTAIPEPGVAGLLTFGGGLLAIRRRRR